MRCDICERDVKFLYNFGEKYQLCSFHFEMVMDFFKIGTTETSRSHTVGYGTVTGALFIND